MPYLSPLVCVILSAGGSYRGDLCYLGGRHLCDGGGMRRGCLHHLVSASLLAEPWRAQNQTMYLAGPCVKDCAARLCDSLSLGSSTLLRGACVAH